MDSLNNNQRAIEIKPILSLLITYKYKEFLNETTLGNKIPFTPRWQLAAPNVLVWQQEMIL